MHVSVRDGRHRRQNPMQTAEQQHTSWMTLNQSFCRAEHDEWESSWTPSNVQTTWLRIWVAQ